MTASESIYRSLLHLYPREFRDEYGEDMVFLFSARAREDAIRIWVQVVGDFVLHAPREHWNLIRRDVRGAFDAWRAAPALPAIAIVALAFGLGGSIAAFSVLHAALLRPLPVPRPDQLVLVRESNAARQLDDSAASLPNYLSWKEGARTLDLAAFSGQSLTWTGNEFPERVEALAPTASFLSVVGVPLHKGRWFTVDEERRGRHNVVVVSDRFWRTRLRRAPDIVGRQLVLNSGNYTIVGVAAPGLVVPSEPDLWVPQIVDAANASRGNRYLSVIGRLKPGVTDREAQTELAAIAARLEHDYPDSNTGYHINLVPVDESKVTPEMRVALLAVLAGTTMVMLVAFTNVANLLLSRVTARRREMAIGHAADRRARRVARQLLTEGALLLSVGALSALGVAATVGVVARHNLVDLLPQIEGIALTAPVLGFALGVTAIIGAAFSGILLWQNRRARLTTPCQAVRSGRDLRTQLIVGQVALTTLLAVGAGLLTQSLLNLQNVSTGFTTESVVTTKIALTKARLSSGAAIDEFLSRVKSDLEHAPGITSAGISSAIPLSPGAFTIMQAESVESGPLATCEWRLVDAGYFRTLNIPLLHGRLFHVSDHASASQVFVISKEAARVLYREANPTGRQLRLENGQTGEVIGIVADVRMRDLDEPPKPVVYLPPAQFGFFPLFNIVVRVDAGHGSPATIIRDRLKTRDPNLAVYDIQSMQHWVERSSLLTRTVTQLVTLLGAVGLVLMVLGVYGLPSRVAPPFRREHRDRRAPRWIQWTTSDAITQTVRCSVAGVSIGLLAAGVVTDHLRTLLFEVDARDPATFAVAGMAVLFLAVTASCARTTGDHATQPD